MMRSSTPKPKPVKKKIKKNVKRRPLKVRQHALERLPNDYIVVRGRGGGLGRPPRPAGLVGAPAPGPASLDPAGYPINNGTPGLPTRDFFDFLGTGLRSASGVFVNAANLFMNLGHQVQQQYGQQQQLPPPSQPASSLGTDTDYQSDYGTIFTDPDDFDDDTPTAPVDIEAPALAPAQEPAPAPAPAPAALPGREFRGTDITDRIETEEELYRLREQVDQLRVQLAGRPTPEQMNELQDRVAGLQQQLIDAQQMIDTREGPGDQTNVQELLDQIAYLDDSLTTAMRTVAVVSMVPVDGQPGEGTGVGGGGDVNQTRRIQQLNDLARELTDEINRSQDRIRELEYELEGRPTRERFEQTGLQVLQLQEALHRENEHILMMLTTLASYRTQLEEARRRPETASIGVGTDTVQLTEAEVNTETPQMIDQMTSTYGRRQDIMARRRRVVSPNQNQNTPSMRDERDATNQPTQQRRRPNESGRPRDPDNRVLERPAVVRRLFPDPPANTDNLALDVATAGAVARQEEFVPAVPEIEPVIEQPPQHNHAPAAPAGRGRGRVPVGQQQRNAALQGGTSSRGRNRTINRRYTGGSS